jgi:hypothetical protein
MQLGWTWRVRIRKILEEIKTQGKQRLGFFIESSFSLPILLQTKNQ